MALLLAYNSTTSDTSTSTFVFDTTDDNGVAFQIKAIASVYDDSTGITHTNNVVSATTNGSGSQGMFTTNLELAPGDYLCLSYEYCVNGAEVSLFRDPGLGQLATSFRLDKPDAGDDNGFGDELVMIYNPDDDSSFNETDVLAAGGSDTFPYLGQGHNATAMVTGTALSTANPDFAEIEALTGTADTTYSTFAGVAVDQKFAIRTLKDTISNTGYDMYVGNIGTDTIESGARFNMTMGGQVNPASIPEPGTSLLVVMGAALISLKHRKRK